MTDVVASPTFVLMAEYEGRLPLFHLDLYRLDDAADALAGGLLDDRQATGVTLVEWAERLGPALPGRAARRRHHGHGATSRDRSRCGPAKRGTGATSRRRDDGRHGPPPRHRHRDDARPDRPRGGRRERCRRSARGSRATATGRSCSPGSRRCSPTSGSSSTRSAGSSSGPALARSPGCASGSRRRRRWRTPAASRSSASRPARRCSRRPAAARSSCSSRPAPSDRVLTRVGEPPRIVAAATSRSSPSARRSIAVDLDGRAPDEAVTAGTAAVDGARGRAAAGRAPRGSRRAIRTTSRRSSPSTSRCRAASARRRPTPAWRSRARAAPPGRRDDDPGRTAVLRIRPMTARTCPRSSSSSARRSRPRGRPRRIARSSSRTASRPTSWSRWART